MEPSADPALFSRAGMKAVDLGGLRVWLGQPVQVTAQVSWSTGWLRAKGLPERSFVHFFPYLTKFPRGELFATYCLDPDARDNPVFISAYQISEDGGAHWGRRVTGLMLHPMIYLPKPGNSLLGIPFELTQQTPGDEHNFVGPSYLFARGGASMLMVPDGVRVVDWPWPVDVTPGPQPRENWAVEMAFAGNAVESENKILLTAYGKEKSARFDKSVLMASDDGGHTWRYFSTIGAADPSLTSSPDRYEGPNETAVVRLADSDLMAVYRVGSGEKWNLRRSYSHDGGRNWTMPDVIPAYSVRPALVRTGGGTIALSTGRPGIDLWLSTDPRGRDWQRIDIVAHHNAWAPDPSYRISARTTGGTTRWQTNSYTAMIEVAPDRLLLIYDRDGIVRPPEQAPSGPQDMSRIFVLPIELERK
jgi:hypothetical protein